MSEDVQVTHVSDLVLGADDSVLREFAELHVMIVCKRAPDREDKHLKKRVKRVCEVRTSVCVRALLLAEDSVHTPEVRQGEAPGSTGEEQLSILRNKDVLLNLI